MESSFQSLGIKEAVLGIVGSSEAGDDVCLAGESLGVFIEDLEAHGFASKI